jgi:hypothetical protein
MYMLVLIINMDNLSRIRNLENVWGRDFRRLSPSSFYTVGTSRRVSDLPIHIVSSRRAGQVIQELLYTFEDHLTYFLTNTTFKWFIRTTEDAFVHLKRLPQMLRDLEQQFDPLKDFVFKGQSVSLDTTVIFVHGGSGWIMSRAACEFYQANMAEINRIFFAEPWGDDLMPSALLQITKGKWEELDHIGWIGSPMDDQSSARVKIGNYSGLPICPTWKFQVEKQRLGRYFKDLVVWHSGRNDIVTVMHGYQAAAQAPPAVFLGHIFGAVTLCEFNAELAEQWDSYWEGR